MSRNNAVGRWDGYPVNRSETGWHWLIPKNRLRAEFPARWSAGLGVWELDGFSYNPHGISGIYDYGGRCMKERPET